VTANRVSRTGRVVVAQTAHSRLFDDELIILDLAAGAYFALDGIGSLAWNGFAAGKNAEEIAAEVANEFDVELERALEDILRLANELVARGLFILQDPAP
jgi:hypothetical protein